MKLKSLINYSLSLGLGGLFIWLTFKGINFSGLASAFKQVNFLYLALYLVVLTCVQLVRTTRWRVMLEPIKKVDFKTMYRVSSVGFMALVLLPFRLGEFARPILIRDKAGVSMSGAMATIVLERVIDAITISAVLAITLLMLMSGGFNAPDWLITSGVIFFLVFFGILVCCVILYIWPAPFEKFMGNIFGRISLKLGDKVVSILQKFNEGLRLMTDWKRLANVFLQSMIYWGLNATGLYLMFVACGLKNAETGQNLPYVAAYVLLCMQVVGITIPSGPGFTGPFDYFTAITVAMFAGIPHSAPQVQLYVILVHGMQLAQQSLFGLFYVLTGYVTFHSIIGRRPTVMDEFDEST